MVKTIYITRHGFRSNWVLDKPMPPPPTGIAADPVLAEHGLEQAEELGAHMKKLSASTPIKHIYVSPFYRCLQTVQPTAKNLGLKVFVEHGVSEWLSRPNYTESPKPASTKVLSEKFFPGLIDESYVPIISESVVGETYEELLARAKNFVSKLIERLDNEYPDVESIMIVTHAATKIVLGRAIVKDDNLAVRTGTCSLDTYVRDDKDSTKWTAEKIGDASFLTNGEEMHWSFEIAYAPGSTEDIAARLQASDGQTVSFDKTDDSSNTSDGKQKEEMVSVYVTLDFSQAMDQVLKEIDSSNRIQARLEKPEQRNDEDDEGNSDDYDGHEDESNDEGDGTEHKKSKSNTKKSSSKNDTQSSKKSAFTSTFNPLIHEGTEMQFANIASDRPLFRFGSHLYTGVWEDMVGTELYSNFDGEIIGKTRSRIRLLPTKVKPRRTIDSEFEESVSLDQKSESTASVTSSSSRDVKQSIETDNPPSKNKGTKPTYDVPRALTLAEKLKKMNLMRDQDTSRETPTDEDEDQDDDDNDDDDDAIDDQESIGSQSWDEDEESLYDEKEKSV